VCEVVLPFREEDTFCSFHSEFTFKPHEPNWFPCGHPFQVFSLKHTHTHTHTPLLASSHLFLLDTHPRQRPSPRTLKGPGVRAIPVHLAFVPSMPSHLYHPIHPIHKILLPSPSTCLCVFFVLSDPISRDYFIAAANTHSQTQTSNPSTHAHRTYTLAHTTRCSTLSPTLQWT